MAQYGRLTTIGADMRANGKRRILCRCECGSEKLFRIDHLRSGATQSCGCLQKEAVSAANGKHRKSGTNEFNIWSTMIQRCTNVKSTSYPRYGGRGIYVCDRWRYDFQAFFDDMGPRPSKAHSIERVDNNGIYEPRNCVWATAMEQVANRRPVSVFGEMAHAAKLTGDDVVTILSSSMTNSALGARFGVTRTAIYNIRSGKTWRRWAAHPSDALDLKKKIEGAIGQ